MKNVKILAASLCLIFSFTLSSCISTETVEDPAKDDSYIVLNINAPENAETRADDGYKLRYVAKLFAGQTSSALTFLKRKEIAGDDLSENNVKNQIVFKVEPNAPYTIFVFADYIPKSYEKSGDQYKDYFYNTNYSNLPKTVIMRPVPGKDSDSEISPDFFNNHNYDSFYIVESLYKSEEEKVLNLELKRATALVEFQETSNTGSFDLNISKLTWRNSFEIDNKSTDTQSISRQVSLSGSIDATEQDVLFFYTFAEDDNKEVNITFSANISGKEANSFEISHIPVKRNYKTLVKRNFLVDSSQSGNVEPENPDPDNSNKGDIILNLSTSGDWVQTTLQ